MALSELAKTAPNDSIRGPACKVCQLLAGLDKPESDALLSMLANPGWRYSSLSEALATEGYDMPQGTLARHARGQCSARTKLR